MRSNPNVQREANSLKSILYDLDYIDNASGPYVNLSKDGARVKIQFKASERGKSKLRRLIEESQEAINGFQAEVIINTRDDIYKGNGVSMYELVINTQEEKHNKIAESFYHTIKELCHRLK